MAKKTKLQATIDSLEYAQSIINTVREPLIALDGDLRVISASRSFYKTFKVTPRATEKKFIYDLGNGQWNIPKLRVLLEKLLPKNETFDDFEVIHKFPKIGKRVMLLNARRIPPPPVKPKRILLAFEDITKRKKIEKELTKYRENLEEEIKERTAEISKINDSLHIEISKQKQTEEGLRTSELRYRRLFETARDGILLIDADSGEIIDANPYIKELLGYSQEEFRGKKLWEIGLLKDIAKSKADFIKLQDKGYIRYEDLPLQTKDGRSVDVEFVSNVYKINHGKIIQCNIRDITERKKVEALQKKAIENLKKVDQMKSDFISMVSHELRTPMAIIREGINQILDGIQGEINEKQQKVLITSRNSIDRLTRIIENLLNISTIEGGKTELKIESVNLTDIVRQTVLSFEHKIKEKGLDLRLDLPQNTIEIYADNDRMVQVLSNLLDNAVKFTLQGFIEISVKEKEDSVECTVGDSGIGISQEDLPHMFTKFQQFSETSGKAEKGTGLGLSITKGIIEMHGGKISVESKLSKGTRFTITLPKYGNEELLEKYINNAINKARKGGDKLSIETFSIAKIAQLKEKFSSEKIKSLLKGIENVLKQSLRRKGDVACRGDMAYKKDSSEMVIILMNCDKENASKVAKRLDKAAYNYFSSQGLGEQVKLRSGWATYPDEAETSEELMRKAREYKK